jgi:hypothetical protein
LNRTAMPGAVKVLAPEAADEVLGVTFVTE